MEHVKKKRDVQDAILMIAGSCHAILALAVILPFVGEWLSLVEHLVRDQGVGGSNPLSPTNYLNPIIELANFQFLKFPQLGSIWVQSANLRLSALLRGHLMGSNASRFRG